MGYTPKPGDRVTAPLLTGEWRVERLDNADCCTLFGYDGDRRGVRVQLNPANLTPVSPPLPPEPAVGEVVWANRPQDHPGKMWIHHFSGYWTDDDSCRVDWSDIATDAEPVVPVSRVTEWLEDRDCFVGANDFRTEFGWGR